MDPHDVAPVFISVAFFLIPIIAILARHQQKMALIIHQRPQQAPQTNSDVEQLSRELRELKQLMHEQALAIDNLAQNQSRLASSLTQGESITERLNS